NRAGVATLYNSAGMPQPMPPLVVSLPNPAGGLLSPTGTVFNGGTAFNSDIFIFASQNGVIEGWRGTLGTVAEVLTNNSTAAAAYTGLAISNIGSNTYLYAADIHNSSIFVLPGTGAPAL